MRNALTLIELIFSIVIIAIVFSVIPKIIYASNKSLQLSIKEDGIYNAVALLGSIYKLPWDENTIQSGGEIVNAGGILCQSNGYRVGGFIGSRNCINHASTNGMTVDDTLNGYNDIDDYDGYDENTTQGRYYNLKVDVNRTTDIKDIVVRVSGNAKTGNFQSSFFYESANIGQIMINKRAW